MKRSFSKLKGHINAIFEAVKEVVRPSTITVQYPKEIRFYENIRGYIQVEAISCLGCARCARICPANAIIMKNVNGRYYPTIDFGKCIFCHFCIDVCPTGALRNTTVHDLAFNNPYITIGAGGKIKGRDLKVVTYEFEKDLKVKR
ncbi:4Fe-4S binding protein [Archaeoglobus profundus]|uniref:4Fe-4S binding protein n=1 Tax=Archaeoglobus profundus TaxID=84156 RepID=UPI00064E9046|nr:4Fe-4S binding protein [Archaeoglobus profundus]